MDWIDAAHRFLAGLFFDSMRDQPWRTRDHENAVEPHLFHSSQIGEDRADGAILVHGERFFCSAACTARRLNLAACYLQLPAAKPHRDLIRAVLSARLAELVDVGALAAHPDVIGVEPG